MLLCKIFRPLIKKKIRPLPCHWQLIIYLAVLAELILTITVSPCEHKSPIS